MNIQWNMVYSAASVLIGLVLFVSLLSSSVPFAVCLTGGFASAWLIIWHGLALIQDIRTGDL